jgi:hypothetical protein
MATELGCQGLFSTGGLFVGVDTCPAESRDTSTLEVNLYKINEQKIISSVLEMLSQWCSSRGCFGGGTDNSISMLHSNGCMTQPLVLRAEGNR